MTTLGRLERVPLRDFWSHEASDFTPWLAAEENISLLNEAIGLDLAVEAQEQRVGPFRADILCKDTNSNQWVLIENQIESTDHRHLGQLLTYAAGLEAVTIVWIAEKFTEEHRATLDWLNQITDERFNFFGLEIELWRIGTSPMAPKFNLVSKPNNWSKAISGVAKAIEEGQLTETKQRQLEYWISFNDVLTERKSIIKTRKPSPQHWQDFSFNAGIGTIHPNATINTREHVIEVTFLAIGSNRLAVFQKLKQQEEAIEQELGMDLTWRELPGSGQITARRTNSDLSDRASWPSMQKWHADTLEAFHRCFVPRVKAMTFSGNPAEESALEQLGPPENEAADTDFVTGNNFA